MDQITTTEKIREKGVNNNISGLFTGLIKSYL